MRNSLGGTCSFVGPQQSRLQLYNTSPVPPLMSRVEPAFPRISSLHRCYPLPGSSCHAPVPANACRHGCTSIPRRHLGRRIPKCYLPAFNPLAPHLSLLTRGHIQPPPRLRLPLRSSKAAHDLISLPYRAPTRPPPTQTAARAQRSPDPCPPPQGPHVRPSLPPLNRRHVEARHGGSASRTVGVRASPLYGVRDGAMRTFHR
ncbi:hypothetical protein BD311DRAFT_240580 [Dichomitus squalens]|uniref:Uncharacterized protein n=1 Tax=Dichomitus squalens TaxID=114155 RepID=A0A4Q9MS73_9APHY|nr:hypothetical protein BD311DRAFT_240580 [Dichomitus squalens]TBU61458.1 hypothetical protein BD310DRAFT_196543 [Dichomitus squalens]